MHRAVRFVLLLATSCAGSDQNDPAAALASDARALAAEASRHAAEVRASPTVDEVGARIAEHLTRMDGLNSHMVGLMDAMGSCHMTSSGFAAVADARAGIGVVTTEANRYRAAHDRHATLDACKTAAGEHEQRVRAQADLLVGESGQMMGGMQCTGMMAR